MESIDEFINLIPNRNGVPDVDDYIAHHIDSLIRCCDNSLYSSAYSHLHLLYMAYIYIQLLRIAKEKKNEFAISWIGLPSIETNFLKNGNSPFSFSHVNESTVFRFFRLIDMSDDDIRLIKLPIKYRNDRLHASGLLHSIHESEFAREVLTYITYIEKIEEQQSKFVADIYEKVISSFDSDYEPTTDDIDINLRSQYHLSEAQLANISSGRTDKFSKFLQDNT